MASVNLWLVPANGGEVTMVRDFEMIDLGREFEYDGKTWRPRWVKNELVYTPTTGAAGATSDEPEHWLMCDEVVGGSS